MTAGSRAAVAMFPQDTPVSNDDVWILPFGGEPPARLTSEDSVETAAVWSPDGTQVAYMSNRNGAWGLYQEPADGGQPERIVGKLNGAPNPSDWSRDGRFILLTMAGPDTGSDVWIVSAAGDSREALPLIQGPSGETFAVFSPDGQWLAYLSNESGRLEVYVRRFEVTPDGKPSSPEAGRRLVSAARVDSCGGAETGASSCT